MPKKKKYNKSSRSLFCYGCAFSDDDEGFPGQPDERLPGTSPCWFCMRNPSVQYLLEIREPLLLTQWMDGSPPAAVPMDCYCPEDMYDQFKQWIDAAVEEATQAQVRAGILEIKREYGIE